MITALKEYTGEILASLLIVMILAFAWLYTKHMDSQTFPQEQYNGAYVWCESQPDAESCRWGAFVALSPALSK